MKSNRNVQKYFKHELIQAVADISNVNTPMVKIVMEGLENVITQALKSASSDTDVTIKLFEGFYIDSTYIPSKEKRNNLTGKLIHVSNKTKIKTRITKGYIEKINQ